jgi:hypothetical protein
MKGLKDHCQQFEQQIEFRWIEARRRNHEITRAGDLQSDQDDAVSICESRTCVKKSPREKRMAILKGNFITLFGSIRVFVNKSLEKKSIEKSCDGTSTTRMSNDRRRRKRTTRIALESRTSSEEDPIAVERTIGKTLKIKQHIKRLVTESSEMDQPITKIQEEKRDR